MWNVKFNRKTPFLHFVYSNKENEQKKKQKQKKQKQKKKTKKKLLLKFISVFHLSVGK